MKNTIKILLMLFTLIMSGQTPIPQLFNSVQEGYYKIQVNGVEQPENFSRYDKMLTAKMNLKYFYPDYTITHTDPGNRIDIDKSLIGGATILSYTKDSICNVFIAKDHSLLFTTTPVNQYTIVFENGESFTAQASTQLLLNAWAEHNLRLYIDRIGNKDYIIKVDIL